MHQILLKYILYKEYKTGMSDVIVKLLKLIFNMALSEFNRSYALRENDVEGIIDDFNNIGLVEQSSEDRRYFYITKLMHSFLQT